MDSFFIPATGPAFVVPNGVSLVTISGEEPPEEEDDWMRTIVDISSAQLKTLGSSPIQLLDPPGAGFMLNIFLTVGIFLPGSTPYGPDTAKSAFGYLSPFPGEGSVGELLSQGAMEDEFSVSTPRYSDMGSMSNYENVGLMLTSDNGEDFAPSAGDGTAKVIIYYDIAPI